MSERIARQLKPVTPFSPVPALSGALQRKCACGGSAALTGECEACRKKRFEGAGRSSGLVQRRSSGAGHDVSAVPPIVHEVLHSPGQPLDTATRAFFEPRFGHDFSRVRIHTDAHAAESARAVNALAYTVGRHMVFSSGRFAPSGQYGKHLLAHELSHVVQQTSWGAGNVSELSLQPHSAAESEANRTANFVVNGRGAADPAELPRIQIANPLVQRRESETAEETEAGEETATVTKPNVAIIWFQFNSTRIRQDAQADSVVHYSLALKQVQQHLQVAGEAGRVVLHGYSSREGGKERNRTLSVHRAERIRDLLIDAGIPSEHIEVVGHGADRSLTGLSWNRRVEVELKPQVTSIEFKGGLEIEGTVPRSGPIPLESTTNVLTPTHWALRKQKRIPSGKAGTWGETEVLKMIAERKRHGKSATLLAYKDQWVTAHKEIIKQSASANNLPDWFLAGVAWAEVGGDPASIDYLAHAYRRDIGLGSKPAEETSFGPVSMQIRRAAEELGYDPSRLTSQQTQFIIQSLEDPQQDLFLVGSHLDRLRNVDFPGKPAELLTDEDIRIIATRYNRGPDLSLEEIQKHTSYGDDLVKKKVKLQKLLSE